MSDKIGRNDLCPCGSGEKHKKCCLITTSPYIHAPYVEVTDTEWQQLRKLEGKLVDDHLMPYAVKELPKEVMALAMSDLLREDFPAEMKTDVLFHNFILPYFLFDWIAGEEFDIPDFNPEITIAENYVNVHGDRLNQREKRFLELMNKTYYSFYSILEVELGRSLTVKDILLGTTHRVKERQGTQTLKRGDIVYSRILTLDHQSIFIGMAPFVLPLDDHTDLIDFKQWLIEEAEEEGLTAKTLRDGVELNVMDYFFDSLVEAFNKPPPTLCNTDGDLINYPAASGRGMSEESQLNRFMKFLILLALIFNITRNHIFIAMFTNRTRKISITPKLPSPKLFFHIRTFLEDFSSRYTLYQRDYFRHTILWDTLHQKMNVIFITSYF